MKNIFSQLTVNRYYKMSDKELEQEASKFKIGEYAENIGETTIVRRRLIIEQLLTKDMANNSRFATFISVIALIISLISIIITVNGGS